MTSVGSCTSHHLSDAALESHVARQRTVLDRDRSRRRGTTSCFGHDARRGRWQPADRTRAQAVIYRVLDTSTLDEVGVIPGPAGLSGFMPTTPRIAWPTCPRPRAEAFGWTSCHARADGPPAVLPTARRRRSTVIGGDPEDDYPWGSDDTETFVTVALDQPSTEWVRAKVEFDGGTRRPTTKATTTRTIRWMCISRRGRRRRRRAWCCGRTMSRRPPRHSRLALSSVGGVGGCDAGGGDGAG